VITVDVSEVASDMRGYLQKVQQGETIIIYVQNRAVAELRPAAGAAPVSRPFGLCAGEFVIPNDFDTPLPENILAGFEGK